MYNINMQNKSLYERFTHLILYIYTYYSSINTSDLVLVFNDCSNKNETMVKLHKNILNLVRTSH